MEANSYSEDLGSGDRHPPPSSNQSDMNAEIQELLTHHATEM